MFQSSELFISQKHIKAKTPDQLQHMMLQIQVQSKISIDFSTPVFASGEWYSWYLYDFSKDVRPQDKLKLSEGK